MSALYLKKKNCIFVADTLFENFENENTKSVIKLLNQSGLKENEKILLILAKPNKQLWLSSRNLKNIEITTGNCLTISHLLKANHIVLSNSSLELINSTYGKN